MKRVCLLVAAGILLAGWAAAAEKRPNFVVILVDDLGWRDLGCYGSEFYETPHLDRFAKSGVQFMQGYAAHPVCSPTRAALMTGQNPARIGITDWIPGAKKEAAGKGRTPDLHHLPLEQVTIAEELREAGYRTFFAGKWHLCHGDEKGYFPEDQGFDVNKGGHHKGSPPGGYYAPYKNPKLKDGPEGEYLPDRLTDETIRFIEASGERPFLAYLSFYTVHTPIQACKRHIEHFQAKAAGLEGEGGFEKEHDGWTKLRQDNPAFASMVRAMDENVGRLLGKLDALGLSESTVVVFTSDNGGLSTLGRKGAPTSVRPLRGGKGWCYEGGIRVPWIIRAPGVTQAGARSEVPIYSADLYPTLLELAGLPPKPEQHLDGLSLVPCLKGGGEGLGREFIAWYYPHHHGSKWRPGAAIREGKWKLVEHYDYEKVELFDLERDPGETTDLSNKETAKTAKLLRKLRNYLKEVIK